MHFCQWWIRTFIPFLLKSAPVEVTHSFTAAMIAPLLGKCCPHSPSFIRPNRPKPEGIKSKLYSGYGRTAQPRMAVCSVAFRLVWGLARCKRKVAFFSCLALQVWAFSLVSIMTWQSELMVCWGCRKSKRITHFLSQKDSAFWILIRNSYVATTETAILTTAHFCKLNPGNCHLQPRIGSIYPDKLAYGVISVPVCAFMGAIWHKLRNIPTLPPLFPMHWFSSTHNFLVVIHQFMWMSCSRCSSFCSTQGCPEYGLSFTLLSSLLKNCLTCSRTLFSQCSASIDECQWVPFFLHGGLQWYTFASYTLPCKTVICCTATKCTGILVGRFSLYCHTTNIRLWGHG